MSLGQPEAWDVGRYGTAIPGASHVDYFWERLSAGGRVEAQQCGWLKDRFALEPAAAG
jgi:hypothetical protein